MKPLTKNIIATLIILILSCLCLSLFGCSDTSNPAETDCKITSFDDATIDENSMTAFMLVDKETDSISLSNKIVCSENSVWNLYYDKLGQLEIPTKIALLKDGDNVFYIVVTSFDKAKVNVYELTIHKSYSALIYYYDNKDNLIYTDTTYTGENTYIVDYIPTIAGYTFNCWKNIDGEVVNEITTFEAVKLYADCTANTYTATLDVDGGNELNETEYTLTYDTAFSFTAPSRTGYSFVGWFDDNTQITDANGKSLYGWNYSSNKTLHAKWSANAYNVTVNKELSAGGTIAGSGEHDYDSTVTLQAITNSGYTWLGWYDNTDSLITEETSYSFTMGLEVTYTAKWIKAPIVKSDNNLAGTVSGMPLTTIPGQQVTVTATTKAGYTWLGWYKENQLLTTDYNFSFTIPATASDITYSAKWIKVNITENNSNAGTTSSLLGTYIPGDKATITAYSNIGYTWLGWYNGNMELTKDLDYIFTMPSENVTYTAKWQLDKKLDNFIFDLTPTTCSITGIKDKTVDTIIVPDYVTAISLGAFSGCCNIENLTIPFVGKSIQPANNDSQYPLGYIFGKSSFTGSVETKQYYYIMSTGNSYSSTYYIPSSLKSVTVTIRNDLRGAFYDCKNLTTIVLPENIGNIDKYAFYGCSNLTSITIPKGVTGIGSYAFAYSGITSITIPYGVNILNSYAFNECKELKSIVIPNSVESIETYAFYKCITLTSVNIPGSVISIGSYAFSYSGLESLTIQNGLQIINNNAFYCCKSLTNIDIPDSVTNIYKWAFAYVAATDIVLPNNITCIYEYTFAYCSNLTSVTIPNSVLVIDSFSFEHCTGLTDIYYVGNENQWSEIKINPLNTNTGHYIIHYIAD